jgi:TRAP-type C4-dicarboxylate transport system permease small subunit
VGLGYAQISGTHVRVEIFLSRFAPGLQKIINIFVLLLLVTFFIVMTWQIGKEALTAWQSKVFHFGTTWQLPTWPAIFVAFIGCILLLISFFIQLVRNIAGFDSKQG